jgi:hypothetical protein
MEVTQEPDIDSSTLYMKVFQLCGLSLVIAPGLIRRVLNDIGADPATATIQDYERALPKLEARLRAYLPRHIASKRVESIRELLVEFKKTGAIR